MRGVGADHTDGPWGAPPPAPESVGRQARKVAAGLVRVVVGLPLLGVSAVTCAAVAIVGDLADAIEGEPGGGQHE